MTVAENLTATTDRLLVAGLEDAESVAEILLAHALSCSPLEVHQRAAGTLTDARAKKLERAVVEAEAHAPPQYIQGFTDFMGHRFKTDARALIPRADTECLVRAVLETLDEDDSVRVLDFGTGTACIAISLKLARECWLVSGADCSPEALELAGENVRKHDLERGVNLVAASSLKGSAESEWDVIVSNPPYITSAEYTDLDIRVKGYEPELALVSGEDGLDMMRHLVSESCRVLKPKGWLFLEIGHLQGSAVQNLLESHGYDKIEIMQDLAGRDRVARASNAGLAVVVSPSTIPVQGTLRGLPDDKKAETDLREEGGFASDSAMEDDLRDESVVEDTTAADESTDEN